MMSVSASLPGHELVSQGLADLSAGRESEASLLVAMAAPRLRDSGAHSRYNALVGRIVSFVRAAEHAPTS
jgi:hypothetical protein